MRPDFIQISSMTAPVNISTRDFLASIDPDLLAFEDMLLSQGFTGTRVLKLLRPSDVEDIPSGLRRLLLYHCERLASPSQFHRLGRDPCTSTPASSDNCRAGSLPPRRLFSGGDSIGHNDNVSNMNSDGFPTDEEIERATYKSPMQRHLANIQAQIKKSELKMESLQSQIKDKTSDPPQEDLLPGGYCSNCHVKGHKCNSCINEKCLTSRQCGLQKKHPAEMKEIQELKNQISQEAKNVDSLQKEADKAMLIIDNNKKSFAYCIRIPLIRSNYEKYLLKGEGRWITLTHKIEHDSKILARHYHNVVPCNVELESQNFKQIIAAHEARFDIKGKTLAEHLGDEIDKAMRQSREHVVRDTSVPRNEPQSHSSHPRAESRGNDTYPERYMSPHTEQSPQVTMPLHSYRSAVGTLDVESPVNIGENYRQGHVRIDRSQSNFKHDSTSSNYAKRQLLKPVLNHRNSPPSKNSRYDGSDTDEAVYDGREIDVPNPPNGTVLHEKRLRGCVDSDINVISSQMRGLTSPNKVVANGNKTYVPEANVGRFPSSVSEKHLTRNLSPSLGHDAYTSCDVMHSQIDPCLYSRSVAYPSPIAPPIGSVRTSTLRELTRPNCSNSVQGSMFITTENRAIMRQRFMLNAQGMENIIRYTGSERVPVRSSATTFPSSNVAYCRPRPQGDAMHQRQEHPIHVSQSACVSMTPSPNVFLQGGVGSQMQRKEQVLMAQDNVVPAMERQQERILKEPGELQSATPELSRDNIPVEPNTHISRACNNVSANNGMNYSSWYELPKTINAVYDKPLNLCNVRVHGEPTRTDTEIDSIVRSTQVALNYRAAMRPSHDAKNDDQNYSQFNVSLDDKNAENEHTCRETQV